jgi:hypothetical protein
MTEVERIKKIIKEDKGFRNNFLGVKNVKTAIAIARSKGFNITSEDVLDDNELSSSLLASTAVGGRNVFEDGWKKFKNWVSDNPAKAITTLLCPPVGLAWEIGESIAEKAANKTIINQVSNTEINSFDQYVSIYGNNNNTQLVNQQGKKE